MDLDSFLSDLRGRTAHLDLPEILGLLRGLSASEELERFARFDPKRYARNPIQASAFHELLALCWLPGQASPFHDHAGSACGVRVIRGTLTETPATLSGESLRARADRQSAAGSVVGSSSADVHRMENRGVEPLVTLHLYSPPLRSMREWASAVAAPPAP